MDSWRINGRPAATINPDDRGLAYGDGLFETMAVRAGALRFRERHMARLQEGCERLAITIPETLADELDTAIEGIQHGTLKLIVTRGEGRRGYSPHGAVNPTLLVGVSEEQAAPRIPEIAARVCKTTVSVNPALAGLKTLNRLEQVLARAEWNDAAIREGVMQDVNGNVISGTMSNVFAVIDGRLTTPDLSAAGIAGVMRSVIVDAMELAVDVRPVALSELLSAEEIFFSNSLIGVWPVSRLNERELQVGPVTLSVCEHLVELGVEECRR